MSETPLHSPLIKPSSSIIRSSKQQTPIKSPSPDHLCRNVLTPTKVRYVGELGGLGKVGVEGYQGYQTQVRERGQGSMNGNGNGEYVRRLEQQIQILSIQNRNLLHRLTLSQQKSHPHLNPQPQPLPPQKSHPNLSPFDPFPRRPTTLILQKIKQQYESNLQTLKLTIEQEMREAMSVVEEMCGLLKDKLLRLQGRVDGVQGRVGGIKVERIREMERVFNRTLGGRVGYREESSISDILCVSIPQQQQQEQQSKNYSVTITKLEQQLESLKQTITQTHTSYHEQKSYLNSLLLEKDRELAKLNNKIQEIERSKHVLEWRYSQGQFKAGAAGGVNLKEELRMLQRCVGELGEELARGEKEREDILGMLEDKNRECDSLTQQISILRDKLVASQHQRILLHQKTKFLQSTLQLQTHQLTQTKSQLAQQLARRTAAQKQRLKRITAETARYSTERNVLTLTSRIDRLLILEQEREEREREIFGSGEETGGKGFVEDQTRLDKEEGLH